MTTFPIRQHWFDSIWPGISYANDKNILVPVQRDTDFEELAPNITDNLEHQFLLVVEDFDHFNRALPEQWLRMPPDGGIPKNVWVGASVSTQKEADERMRRLVKIRARKLFVMLKKGHSQGIGLEQGLIAWRCSNCGRKDGYARMRRPGVCPTGVVCRGSTINPQIHWVVSMEAHGSLKSLCQQMGVAFWDGDSTEVPE